MDVISLGEKGSLDAVEGNFFYRVGCFDVCISLYGSLWVDMVVVNRRINN